MKSPDEGRMEREALEWGQGCSTVKATPLLVVQLSSLSFRVFELREQNHSHDLCIILLSRVCRFRSIGGDIIITRGYLMAAGGGVAHTTTKTRATAAVLAKWRPHEIHLAAHSEIMADRQEGSNSSSLAKDDNRGRGFARFRKVDGQT